MNSSFGIVGAAAGLAMFAMPAFAATETFDFACGGSLPACIVDQSSATFLSTPGGESVNVIGRNYTIGSGGSFIEGAEIDVENNSHGLISKNWSTESHTIDSKGDDEAMIFTFERAVHLTSIVIGWFEGTGYYDLFAGNSIGELVLIGNSMTGISLPTDSFSVFAIGARATTETTTYTVTNTAYRIGSCLPGEKAVSYSWYYGKKKYKCEWTETKTKTETKDSGIKIKTLVVDYPDLPPTTPVPLPAGGLLLLTGLAGLGIARRKRA